VKPSGVIVTCNFSKKTDKTLDTGVVRVDIPIKKIKNAFNDVL
jgi:hypothetical protein